jgi:hypothetical protein
MSEARPILIGDNAQIERGALGPVPAGLDERYHRHYPREQQL